MSNLSFNLSKALASAVVTAAALTGGNNAIAAGCAGAKCGPAKSVTAKCGACKAKCGACKAGAHKAKHKLVHKAKAKCGAKCSAKCGAATKH